LLHELLYFTWQDVLLAVFDITVVSYLFYRVFILIRGTRAVQLLKGIAVLFALEIASRWARLYTINWLLEQVRTMLIIALPIVFHPEIRRALEQIGRGSGIFSRSIFRTSGESSEKVIDEIIKAVFTLASNRTGALIVIERETGLEEYIEGSVRLDSLVASELLQNLFVVNTPLHDGAVIIRGDRVVAAACFLPSTQEPVGVELGSRHRAAIGVTQVSDSLCIVVSEESGTVSVAVGGRLIRGLDKKTLKDKMMELLVTQQQPVTHWFHRGSSK
jgi:diadenylate cyclase